MGSPKLFIELILPTALCSLGRINL